MEYSKLPGHIAELKSRESVLLRAVDEVGDKRNHRESGKVLIKINDLWCYVRPEAVAVLLNDEAKLIHREREVLEEHHETLSKVAAGLLQ